jgi:sn-glycerol 3-phosphate transport system substrate-binding protein
MPTNLSRRSLLAGASLLAAPAVLRAQTVEKLTFYYPIAVGGPIQTIIDGYCQDYRRETGVEVSPVYAGDYGETLTKAVTAIRGGAGPQFAVLLAAEIHSLQQMDILLPLDDMGPAEDLRAWLDGFYPAFLVNSRADGKIWSVPFQRSTAIAYYNKAAFAQVGLDPDKPPRTWQEQGEAAEKLTAHDGSGRVTRWGLKIAGDLGNAQWTFGALANQNDHRLMNDAGTEVYFDKPGAIQAMEYWRSLSTSFKATPDGVTAWPTLAPDFLEGNTAIIWSTTGNLTNIRGKASFPFGVAGLPGKQSPHTVVGGGNLYFFKNASPAERTAALRFARWVSAPERAADWSRRTGYIATRPDAYETPDMKAFLEKYPDAGVARDFLPVATGELSTFENRRVYKTLTDNIQACLGGSKTPEQAMHDAQAESDRILRPFKT